MKLALNDIDAKPGDVFTDRTGRYRRVTAATERFMAHVPASQWVEVGR